MNSIKKILMLSACCILLVTSLEAASQEVKKNLDYSGMVAEIGRLFQESLNSYKAGDVEEAKSKSQNAYFEVFENLEGPIRINISARKNHELEYEFGAIRKMIVGREPVENVKDRMNALMNELYKTVTELEKGYQLVSQSEAIENRPIIDSAVQKPVASDLPGFPVVEVAQVEPPEIRSTDQKDWHQVKSSLLSAISESVDLYAEGNPQKAINQVQNTYFDIFESSGMETKIGSIDSGLKTQLEGHFSLLIGQMKDAATVQQLQDTKTKMTADFERAVKLIGDSSQSPLALFFYSLMIIVREGFEAILIITAIIAYLIKTENRDKLGVIYNACIVALVCSVITAVLVKWVFKISSASQEVLEGITMILAAVVLFSISYWLISKVEAQKWIRFIKGKVSKSVSSGSLKTLWFSAFLAVYREGAETVLFYEALTINSTPVAIWAIIGGFAIGCCLLAGIYLIMRFSSIKLPLRSFFIVTGALLYYMAFVFAGQGVMELIEGKVLEPSLISWIGTVSFLGIYPYWQTLFPQLIMLLAALAAIAVTMKPKRHLQ